MAPDLEQEAALIRAFIIPTKRERLVELLAKPKRRQDVLNTLYHFAGLDPRFISRIHGAESSAEGIEALLRSKGAPDLCYAISTDSELDGRTVPLREASDSNIRTGARHVPIVCAGIARILRRRRDW